MSDNLRSITEIKRKIEEALRNEDAPLSFDLDELSLIGKAIAYSLNEWWDEEFLTTNISDRFKSLTNPEKDEILHKLTQLAK